MSRRKVKPRLSLLSKCPHCPTTYVLLQRDCSFPTPTEYRCRSVAMPTGLTPWPPLSLSLFFTSHILPSHTGEQQKAWEAEPPQRLSQFALNLSETQIYQVSRSTRICGGRQHRLTVPLSTCRIGSPQSKYQSSSISSAEVLLPCPWLFTVVKAFTVHSHFY